MYIVDSITLLFESLANKLTSKLKRGWARREIPQLLSFAYRCCVRCCSGNGILRHVGFNVGRLAAETVDASHCLGM